MRRGSLQGKFGVVLIGFVAVMATQVLLTVRTVQGVSKDLLQMRETDVPRLIRARDMLNLYLEIEAMTEEAVLTGEQSLLDSRDQVLGKLKGLLDSGALDHARGGRRGPLPHLQDTLKRLSRQETVSRELVLRLIDPTSFTEMEAVNTTRVTALAAENNTLGDEIRSTLGDHVAHERDALGDSVSRVRQRITDQFRTEAVIVSLAVAVFLTGFFVLARRIVVPLRRLSEASGRVADGDLSEMSPIPLLSDDEIGDLAGAFERMTRGLRRSTVSRDQLDRILESIPECVIVCDAAGAVMTVNRSVEKLLGWRATDLRGRGIDVVVADEPADRSALEEATRSLHHDGTFEPVPMAWKRKGGGEVPVMFAGATLLDRDGVREGIVYSAIDFRERRRIEAELRAAKLAAEEAARSKGLFLATMSHEIRTPMAAILGFSENLLDPDQTEEERIEAVQTIHANSRHLLEVISSVLDVSKIEAGKLDVERIPVRIVSLLDELARIMVAPARAKGLDFRVEFRGGLPVEIVTDPTRLRQILVNLAGNAIKFTEKGGIRVVVTFRNTLEALPHTQPTLDIEIIDSGIGMSEEAVSQVFQAFSQADGTTTRRFGGTGLGLTISRRLAELLGGGITVQSRGGRGSTFCVCIGAPPVMGSPILPPEEHRRRSRDAEASSGSASFEDLALLVLVAEDNAVNQRLIAMILEKAGATVEIAENGRVAVDKCVTAQEAGRPFDVVLMDMQMPEMDGLEATRTLRAHGDSTPIVALTANAMASDREACMAAGCDDFETKPIRRQQLLEKIRRLAGSARTA